MSKGHSGGPVYMVYNNSQYVFGVIRGDDCGGTDCGAYPNHVRAIEPEWWGMMLNFMSQ